MLRQVISLYFLLFIWNLIIPSCYSSVSCPSCSINGTVADCRYGVLKWTKFPDVNCLPEGVLEVNLQFQNLNDLQMPHYAFNLEYLFLDTNQISSIKSGTFYEWNPNNNLSYLSLTGNKLQIIDKFMFYGLNELDTLALDANSIERLPAQVFYFVPNLKVLTLCNNKISNIDPSAFDRLHALEILDLSHNLLATRIAFMEPLTGLLLANLSYNHLAVIDADAFRTQTQLSSLFMSGNSIHTIEDNAFTSMQQLQHLYLDENELRRWSVHAFAGLVSLLNMNLSGNPLTELQGPLLPAESALHVQYLSACNMPLLDRLSADVFAGMDNLILIL